MTQVLGGDIQPAIYVALDGAGQYCNANCRPKAHSSYSSIAARKSMLLQQQGLCEEYGIYCHKHPTCRHCHDRGLASKKRLTSWRSPWQR